MKSTRNWVQLITIMAIIQTLPACTEDNRATPAANFENYTEEYGLQNNRQTFSVAVSDLNSDGRDDLLIGNHGFPANLYLNAGEHFKRNKQAFKPEKTFADRHGYTIVDLDNDGDKDIVYAGGGADGVGEGTSNGIYRNLLIEEGALQFREDGDGSDIGMKQTRTRHLFAVPSDTGAMVDLYLTALHSKRKGSKNYLIKNTSTPAQIRLNRDPYSSLNKRLESDGKDLLFDFNRDGLIDFLHMGFDSPRLFINTGNTHVYFPSVLDGMNKFASAVAADLNNDGYPEIYLGKNNIRSTQEPRSDHVNNNSTELHFSLEQQSNDGKDELSFKTSSQELRIDFKYRMRGKGVSRRDAGDIFLGAKLSNPKSRVATITREDATGRPADINKQGTYLWYDATSETWHVENKYNGAAKFRRIGLIRAADISNVQSRGLETLPVPAASDALLINEAGVNFKLVDLPAQQHHLRTSHLTAADFNNDGLVDLAGTRTGELAGKNGVPFLQMNRGNLHFSLQELPDDPVDDIFRADIIVHGFFNDDWLPDLFFTNGYGLGPSHIGPYQLWLNTTQVSHPAIVLELEGTISNRDAIGAQVELRDNKDKLLGYRELGANYGRGQDTHKLHFGLGAASAPYRLIIRWPGQSERQTIELTKSGFHFIKQKAAP